MVGGCYLAAWPAQLSIHLCPCPGEQISLRSRLGWTLQPGGNACPASTLSYPSPAEQTNNYDLVLRGQLAGVPAAQQQAALAVAKPVALALLTPRLNDSSQNYAGFTFGAPVPGL